MADAPLSPLPIPARALLQGLRSGTAGTPESIAAQALALLREPPVFPRRKRLLQLAICCAIPLTMMFSVWAAIQWQVRARTANPESYALKACTGRLLALERKGDANLTPAEREQRELIEVYIAERLRNAVEASAAAARSFASVGSIQREYRVAARALANHPQRSPEQVAKADALVEKLIANQTAGLAAFSRPVVLWTVLAVIAGGALAFVAGLGLLGSLICRGGFTLRGFGAALVLADGRDASRLRALLRAVVAWSPLLVWFAALRMAPPVQRSTAAIALAYTTAILLLAAGAIWAWLHPSRGIQDRAAGTWIVPRQ